jgi:hypothetical protein
VNPYSSDVPPLFYGYRAETRRLAFQADNSIRRAGRPSLRNLLPRVQRQHMQTGGDAASPEWHEREPVLKRLSGVRFQRAPPVRSPDRSESLEARQAPPHLTAPAASCGRGRRSTPPPFLPRTSSPANKLAGGELPHVFPAADLIHHAGPVRQAHHRKPAGVFPSCLKRIGYFYAIYPFETYTSF